MKLLHTIIRKVRLFVKSKRLSRFRRSPKIFVPTPSRWQVVIPFKGMSVVLIVFLVLASGYLFIRSDLFLVKDLKVRKLGGWEQKEFVATRDAEKTLLPLLAQSIFTVSAREIEDKLQNEFLAISEVQVKKELPDRLVVSFSERLPVAVIRAEQLSMVERIEKDDEGQEVKKTQKVVTVESFLVDSSGLIFAKKEGKIELPELELAGEQANLGVGSMISGEQVLAAISVIKTELDLGRVRLLKLILQPAGVLEAHYSDNMVVLFDASGKKIDLQISSLQSLYQRAKIEGRQLNRVDLRFDRPVVE